MSGSVAPEKPARLDRVNVVHRNGIAGRELPTERSSKPVAFALSTCARVSARARACSLQPSSVPIDLAETLAFPGRSRRPRVTGVKAGRKLTLGAGRKVGSG
jgi:hypothetical protein